MKAELPDDLDWNSESSTKTANAACHRMAVPTSQDPDLVYTSVLNGLLEVTGITSAAVVWARKVTQPSVIWKLSFHLRWQAAIATKNGDLKAGQFSASYSQRRLVHVPSGFRGWARASGLPPQPGRRNSV